MVYGSSLVLNSNLSSYEFALNPFKDLSIFMRPNISSNRASYHNGGFYVKNGVCYVHIEFYMLVPLNAGGWAVFDGLPISKNDVVFNAAAMYIDNNTSKVLSARMLKNNSELYINLNGALSEIGTNSSLYLIEGQYSI